MQSINSEILEVESLLEIPNADPVITQYLLDRLKNLKRKFKPIGELL